MMDFSRSDYFRVWLWEVGFPLAVGAAAIIALIWGGLNDAS